MQVTGKSDEMKGSVLPMTTGAMIRAALSGIVLWFMAALMIRFLYPVGAFDGAAQIITYALVIPGTLPFLMGTFLLLKTRPHNRAVTTAILVGTATLFDGAALAWFPSLYGPDLMSTAKAGSVILWGAGVGLWLGILMNKPARV